MYELVIDGEVIRTEEFMKPLIVEMDHHAASDGFEVGVIRRVHDPLPEWCPMCGVWKCAKCGWTRTYANRFAKDPQTCGICHSEEGQMLPVRHMEHKARGHAKEYTRHVRQGLMPRYPL